MWLNGMAGTGKSTIARTIAREYHDQGRLGASFFFSRGGGDLGTSDKIITTLAAQLAAKSPIFKSYICNAISENSDIGNLGLYDQWERLILKPLSRLESGSFPLPLVFVIDALDECEGDDDIKLLLTLLAKAKSLKSVQLRVLITSRPETPIRLGFRAIDHASERANEEIMHHDLVLHDVPRAILDHDIRVLLKAQFEKIRQDLEHGEHLPTDWPGVNRIDLLVQKAGGLFIYVATVCRFVGQGGQFAERRLSLILQHDNTILPPEEKLNEIYTTILTHLVRGEHNEEETEELRKLFDQIVGSIVILFNTLSVTSLAGLLGIQQNDVSLTLTHLHSVLDVPESKGSVIRLLHPSFRDFLLNQRGRLSPHFSIDEKRAHYNLYMNCLRIMSNHLKRDICNLRVPGARAAELKRSEIDRHIPPHVQYACRHWIHHFKRSDVDSCDYGDIEKFLRKHILYWLEALALMGCMSDGAVMVNILDSMLAVSESVQPPSSAAK